MGLRWEAKTYGTRRVPEKTRQSRINHDVKNLKSSRGDIIGLQQWNDIKNLIASERTRLGLDNANLVSSIPSGDVKANQFLNLLHNADLSGKIRTDVDVGHNIKASGIGVNDIVDAIMAGATLCNCDNNFCSCDCDNCVCNCDYRCTCDCAYNV